MKKAYLLLEDGSIFTGKSFGAAAPCAEELTDHTRIRDAGEAVFTTSMAGYHEMLSDPSVTGQIVIMTYPHIGNYGVDAQWTEAHLTQSDRIYHAAGLVVRSHYEGPIPPGRTTLEQNLISQGVPGITEVDTRRLTIELRDRGSRNGLIFSPKGEKLTDEEFSAALAWLKEFPPMTGRDLVSSAGIKKREVIHENGSFHMAVIDCGIKENIIRCLVARDVKVSLFPSTASADEILSAKPQACLVSNGPGDPSVLEKQIGTFRQLIGKIPLFGICLGHQLIVHALGGVTYKMEFGHHGGNHPVRDELTKKTFVTSQNHGFAVDKDSLPEDVTIWFTNANDGTVEGIFHDKLPVMSVQFHPEAAPGPQESAWIFDRFLEEARKHSTT